MIRSFPRTRPWFILLSLLAGCSSLTPQIFSERLQVYRNANNKYELVTKEEDVTLDLAYADAAFVRKRYITAMQDQGNAVPQLSAALLGLSAATLFKGLTNPNTTDIAGAGVLGSAGWAMGNTLLSKPRLDVYRSGARALTCAMAAVEPVRRVATGLGAPGDRPEAKTVHGGLAGVQEQRDALDLLIAQHEEMSQPLPEKVAAVPARTQTVSKRRPCPAVPAGTSAAQSLVLQAECAKLPPIQSTVVVEAAKPEGTIEQQPSPAVRAAFKRARREVQLADGTLDTGQKALAAAGNAGALLWKKSAEIQLAVSEQVDKNMPDLASVMRAAQGMRDSGFLQGGAAVPAAAASAAADAHGADKQRQQSASDRAALREIQQATLKLGRARAALDRRLRPFTGLDEPNLIGQLNSCSVDVTGVRLAVTPAGDEVTVAIGSTQVFFVSGGSGVPRADVVAGPTTAALQFRPEGGQFRFEFTPPTGVEAGDSLLVRFTDGAGAATHTLQVRIAPAAVRTAAAPAASEAPASAASGTAPARPATPGANTEPVRPPPAPPVNN